MKVLAILSSKGGVGKSALARSLAVAALIDGRRSAIIDADEQGTVTAWGKRRRHPAPAVLPLGGRTIEAATADLKGRGAEFVTVDTPPHARPLISIAAETADACLIVAGPYPEDLEAVASVARIVTGLTKPAAIVLNKTPSRAAATSLARAALATFQIPVCPTAITQLVVHPYASAAGETAQELEPDGKGASEIAAVFAWLKERSMA